MSSFLQYYNVHLITGEVLSVAEDYYLPFEKGTISAYEKAKKNQVICFGDGIYVIKSNILYIQAAGVRKV